MKTISIIGGCGHVGLPLGLALASRGHQVQLIDINKKAVDTVNNKQLPFLEAGAEELLQATIGKTLRAYTSPETAKGSDVVFFVTGGPANN